MSKTHPVDFAVVERRGLHRRHPALQRAGSRHGPASWLHLVPLHQAQVQVLVQSACLKHERSARVRGRAGVRPWVGVCGQLTRDVPSFTSPCMHGDRLPSVVGGWRWNDKAITSHGGWTTERS